MINPLLCCTLSYIVAVMGTSSGNASLQLQLYATLHCEVDVGRDLGEHLVVGEADNPRALGITPCKA